MIRPLLVAVVASIMACAPSSWEPVLGEHTQVIPGPGLPSGTFALESNNNVSIAQHGDRLFLAWRTAPNHFASSEAHMHVMSSPDLGGIWEFEATWALGADVREPLLFEFEGVLRLSFFEAGINPLAFEPKQMWRTERRGPADWTGLEAWGEVGEVPWEAIAHDGVAWLTSYWGPHYDLDSAAPVELRMATSTDGTTWDQSVVYEGGVSEAAFQFDDEGVLWAVGRNEDGDETGFGTLLCTAPTGSPTDWACPDVSDPYRYDSPRMFVHEGELYMVARRNPDGPYQVASDELDFLAQRRENLLSYSAQSKRTALYRIDRDAHAVVHLFDLPSAGDTSFPSVVQLDAHRFLVANYTSPLEDPDITWLAGQLSEEGTSIYLVEIAFEPVR